MVAASVPDYSDFTVEHYKSILEAALRRYQFRFLSDEPAREPHIIWRHDLDASVHQGLNLARIESEYGVRSTYFVRIHGEFYNPFESGTHDMLKRIVGMNHRLGLHFEGEFYGKIRDRGHLEGLLLREKRTLEEWFGVECTEFSFHNPQGAGMLGFDEDAYCGMANSYGRTIKNSYKYVSDSNGYWRHDRLYDVVSGGEHARLHVLTHPEWWHQRPMTPKERIKDAIDRRAGASMEAYLALLRSAGRADVG